MQKMYVRTSLTYAAEKDTTEVLLQCGDDVNTKDDEERTRLTNAEFNSQRDTANRFFTMAPMFIQKRMKDGPH